MSNADRSGPPALGVAFILVLGLGIVAGGDGTLQGWAAGAGGCGGGTVDPTVYVPDEVPDVVCASFFTGSSWTGEEFRLCTDGSTEGTFEDDSIASVRLAPGLMVRVCTDPERAGDCRDFYADVPAFGGIFESSISSLELGQWDPGQFQLVMASDSQLFWSKCSPDEEACYQGEGSKEAIGRWTNQQHVDAMNALRDYFGFNLVGVIMNGDLTAFGHRHEFEAYEEYYEGQLRFNLWPGLGNHDYQNNVDDCYGNNCARRMLNYMRGKVEDMNTLARDWESRCDFEFPAHQCRYTGSFSYSWVIGDVRFVQLHNSPKYETRFSGWDWGGGNNENYEVTASTDWLRGELDEANSLGQRVILNAHIPEVFENDPEFHDVLEIHGQNVIAVMVGHYHSMIGRERWMHTSHRSIPVIWGGSALYQRFILVTLDENTMTTEVIGTAGGSQFDRGEKVEYPAALEP